MWEQLQRLAGSLSRKQQMLILGAAVAVFGGLFLLQRYQREKDFRPLFTGLSAEDGNQVVTRLRESNIEFRLADNGSSVLVPSARVAETRLMVAGSGLPKTGRIGFELFDKTTFGTTDFAEQINYRRALEGELERSVMSLAEVEHARVHLTFPKESVFSERRQPAKASVLLRLKGAVQLSPRNVQAIGHLLANAVEGLSADGVTIVDMQGNLLNRVKEEMEGSYGALDYKQKVEHHLLAKVQATLEPLLGPEHYRAGVSVEVDQSSAEQSEETFDPNRSVMMTQQRSEEMAMPAGAGGIPGTASSLPRPTSRPATSQSGVTRRSENITYQTSRTVRKTLLPQGSVRRVSVSALVDQQVRWEGTGAKARRVLEPPGEEMLKKVRELIAGAIGFNAERGDQIVIQSLPFESTLRQEPPAPPAAPAAKPPPGPWWQQLLADKNVMVSPIVLIAAAALVLLIVGSALFLMIRRRRKRPMMAEIKGQATLPAGSERLPAVRGAGGVPAVPVPSDEERESEKRRAELELLNSIRLPELTTKKAEVLVKQISEQAKSDPHAAAQLLRTWVSDREP